MTSPSDTSPIVQTITARVHGNAINRVPKLFTDSLCAIFTELLQNARRAGATRLNVNTSTTCVTPPNSAAHCITVADNGAGIADPAILLSFGETGWDNATATREDAAGMGLAAGWRTPTCRKPGCSASPCRSPRPSSPPGSPKPRTTPIGTTPPTTTTPLALNPCS